MESLTIGILAKRANVHIETVRYYEKKGLISEPPRTESGYRMYPLEVVARIEFIKGAQGLGFSLKEISELLSLRVDRRSSCGDVKKRADNKIVDIDEKIRALQRMRDALHQLSLSCKGSGPTSECPILEAFEKI